MKLADNPDDGIHRKGVTAQTDDASSSPTSLFTSNNIPEDSAYEEVDGDYDLEWWKRCSDKSPDGKETTETTETIKVQPPDEDPEPGWTVVRSRRQPKTEKDFERRPSPALDTTDRGKAVNARSRKHQPSYAEMTRRNDKCSTQKKPVGQALQPGWKAPVPPDDLIFDLMTSPRLMRERMKRLHSPRRKPKPRLTPRVPLHCLVPPIFDKPKPKPRHRGKDRSVKNYQSSPRRVKKSQSRPCSTRVRNAITMRQMGLPGKDFDDYNRGFLQAYEDAFSGLSSTPKARRSGKTGNEIKVRLPAISSNRSAFSRRSVSAVPSHSTKQRPTSLSIRRSPTCWPGARAVRAQ